MKTEILTSSKESGIPPLGVIMLDHELTRPPGDPGNPLTFAFPTLHKVLPKVSLERLLQGERTILEPLLAAGHELAQAGVWAITTGCGFFVLFQNEAARALPVPVFLSSLLQIPLAQASIGPGARVGVLTAHSGRLTPAHIKAAGVANPDTVTVKGLEDSPHFAEGVLKERGPYDSRNIRLEVVDAARKMIKEDPRVGALVLECTNLPPFAKAIQDQVGLPVYDITTLADYAYRTRFRSGF